MQPTNTTSNTAPATAVNLSSFTKQDLTMAREALSAAITTMNLTACLANYMRRDALEEFADDHEARLIEQRDAIDLELRCRSEKIGEPLHG